MNKIPPIPRFTTAQIREAADRFRAEHFGAEVPVDVMSAMEFDLGMEVRPVAGLKQSCGMDALIMSNMDIVYVDQNELMDESQDNRLRFSLAHELGHRALHREFYEQLGISNVEDAYSFMSELPDEYYTLLELFHANEFAGRLLVPLPKLINRTQETVEPYKITFRQLSIEPATVLDQVSPRLAKEFGVSDEVMSRRLEKEKIVEYINWD